MKEKELEKNKETNNIKKSKRGADKLAAGDALYYY